MIAISINNFQAYKNPIVLLKDSFNSTRGIPPSKVPAGHINSQKYGFDNPNSLVTNIGKIITNTNNITYLRYFKAPSNVLFTLTFFTLTLYNKSWINPNGHNHPHINLPNTTPNKVISPTI